MIDVLPIAPGEWLARCECGATARFPEAEQGWDWVLGHPCPPQPEPVIDLTERQGCQKP